jgi:hypothetical protein
MKTKNTAWTASEDALLAQAVEEKISAARLSVRLRRSEASVKRRMRDLGLTGTKRLSLEHAAIGIDPTLRAERWLESCRFGDLTGMMKFYHDEATLECGCTGAAVYAGAAAIQEYWAPKLRRLAPRAFSLGEVQASNGRVVIDYLSYEAKPVRIYMSFDAIGKIVRSECAPLGRTAEFQT